MSTEYAGNNIFPATITVPSDGDLDAAAAYAVAMEQLADRTAYLSAIISGGMSLSFTNATFHGATVFADGSINGTLGNPSSLTFGHFFHMTVADNASLISAMGLALGGETIEVNAATSFDLFAFATSMSMGGGITTINADNGINLNGGTGVTLNVNAGSGVSVTGGGTSYVNFFAGRFAVDNSSTGTITLNAAAVSMGSGSGSLVTINSPFVCNFTGTINGGATINGAGTINGTASFNSGATVTGGLSVTSGKLIHPTTYVAPVTGTAVDYQAYYELILSNAMASDAILSLNHSLVTVGQRVRVNAQLVTGAYTYYLQTGDGREWAMRNTAAAGSTVIVEFVSNGSGWVVDDWAPYNAVRNGI